MMEYLKPIFSQIQSTWIYIIDTISQKWWRTPWIVEYVIFFGFLYLIAIFVLHKIYHFFVKSALKRKANYFFAFDAVLYQYQNQNISDYQDLSRIKDIIKEWSYEKSYSFLSDKAKLLSSEHFFKQLKKSYNFYKSANRIKKLCGTFLILFTLWIYKLFLEN